jgi:hypothetical protein
MIKMPPKQKIYEAYSAIADNRIKISLTSAIVTSSDYNKTYEVKWNEENYSSNDNASFWQGYAGYPVIAVLMIQNKLPYNKEIATLFQNINWHNINNLYKRDYDKAINEVLKTINYDENIIKKEVDKVYNALNNLEITIKRKI